MRFRLAAAGAALAAGALALVPAAYARPEWLSGPGEESTVVSCESVQAGAPVPVVGAAAFSEKRVDRRRQPRVGQTFYVRTLVGAVGDPCIAQQLVHVELVLPRGVRLAITRRTRVDCFYVDLVTELRTRIPRRGGCPATSTRGVHGRAFRRTGLQGPNWALALGQALEIQVPVRASRPMRGRTRPTAGCGRTTGAPPCPRRRAGNHLQFSVRVFDGNANPFLVPHVALTVRPKERKAGVGL
jgi:hypothetical protein